MFRENSCNVLFQNPFCIICALVRGREVGGWGVGWWDSGNSVCGPLASLDSTFHALQPGQTSNLCSLKGYKERMLILSINNVCSKSPLFH